MAMAVTAAQLSLIGGARYTTHWRLLIEDADGVMRDYSDQQGIDWRKSAEWGKTVDQPIADGTVEVFMEADGISLAPLIGGSPLNRDSAGGYAKAIDMGRKLQIWTQDTEVGVAAVEADWVLVHDAIIQKVGKGKGTLRLSTLDRAALLNRIVRHENVYGTAAGTPVADVMQALIDDTLGVGVFTLQLDGDPQYAIVETKPFTGRSVWDALEQLSAEFAGYVEYRDALTLVTPDRSTPTAASAVATIGPDQYKTVPRLDTDLADIRNDIDVTFRNSATGAVETVNAVDTASKADYDEQFMGIPPDIIPSIDTTTEAQDMADRVVSDIGQPRYNQQVVNWYWYPVELGDHITWQANGHDYDSDQHWAVTGYRHRLSKDKRETTFDVRGKASAGFKRWTRKGDEEADRPGALTASIVFNAANEAVVQANAPAGTSSIYITVGVDADPADPSSSSNDASIAGDSGRVNTGIAVAEGSVGHVKVRADSGPVILVLAKNVEGGNISVDEQSFDASNSVHVSVIGSPPGTTNLYITVGAGTAPADPTSTTYDATIAGDSGSVNTGVIVSAGEVAHVKVGAHDGTSMTDIASFTRANDQATGNQIILGTPRWSPLSGGAILEQPIDFGTDTRSVRVQYQYASPPGGTLDTTVDYTFDTGTGGGIVTHSVEDEMGAIKEWDAAEAAPSITYTPYDGITGGGNAGNSKTITPDAPGDTGSVGGRVDNKTAALTRPAQGSIIEFDDDSGLEAYVTAGGGAGVRVKASKVWAISQGGTGSSASPAEAGYIWRSTGVDAMGLYDLDSALAGKSGTGHTHALGALSDVAITSVGSGEVLGYTTGWINRTLAEAGISAVGHTHTLENLDSSLAGLVSVSGGAITGLSGSNADDYIRWDGTSWVIGPLGSHTHDDRYYTEGEIDTILTGPAGTVLKGTDTGSSFGALVASDIPDISASKVTAGTFGGGDYAIPGGNLGFVASTGLQYITYRDSGGSNRVAVYMDHDNDVVALANRAANGVVQIRANTTAGGAGEAVVATFSRGTYGLDLTGDARISGALTLSTALPVASGGTGLGATYAAGDIIYALGASDLTTLGVGTSPDGHVLTLVGGTPAWAAPSGTSGFSGTRTWVSGSDEHTVQVTDGVIDSWTVGPAPA